MAKDNLISLAKGKNNVKKSSQVLKKPVPKAQEKHKTPEEERDLKAKKKVEELLQDVDLEIINKEEKNVLDEHSSENGQGIEWLTEQVGLLSEQNENLRNELAQAKDDYSRLLQDFQNKNGNNNVNETILQNMLILFNELQNNFLGINAEKTSWTTASIPHMLKKMLSMFPFLETYKKF